MNLLEQLARKRPTLTVADVKALLEASLGTPISLVDPDSRNPKTNEPREVRCDAKLSTRFRTGKRIELRAVFSTALSVDERDTDHNHSNAHSNTHREVACVDPQPPMPRASLDEHDLMSSGRPSWREPQVAHTSHSNKYSEVLVERFIRDMESQERRRSFVWIGYVAKTMLPGFGLSEDEANSFLEQLESEEIVIRSQRPNPRNPEFPSTGIQLNRSHASVQRVLGEKRVAPNRFPLGTVRGEPLSQSIIRERR